MQKHWERYGKKLGIYGKLLVSFLIILGIPIIASTFYYSYTCLLYNGYGKTPV